MSLGDVTGGSFHEFRPPELPARVTCDDGIAGPVRRAKYALTRPAGHPLPIRWREGRGEGLVKTQPARALMLWRVVKHARFIDHVGQMPRMLRWKSVMAPRLNVQEFIERIAVGHPRGAFLVGAKKVAVTVEREADSEANTGAHRLALGEIRADTLNRPAFQDRAIPRLARGLINQIRFGKTRRAEAEVNAPVRSHSNAERVHTLLFAAFGPGRHGDLRVGTIVSVGVHDQRQLFFRGDEHAVAARVAGRRQRCANRRAQGLLLPERLDLVLQSVAVAVAQQPEAALVTDPARFAVRRRPDSVQGV